MMACHKNSLVQGISKFIKINGVLSNLFKTNLIKVQEIKILQGMFLQLCLCSPFPAASETPWEFLLAPVCNLTHGKERRREKPQLVRKEEKMQGGEREIGLWAPLSYSCLAATSPLLGDLGSAPRR